MKGEFKKREKKLIFGYKRVSTILWIILLHISSHVLTFSRHILTLHYSSGIPPLMVFRWRFSTKRFIRNLRYVKISNAIQKLNKIWKRFVASLLWNAYWFRCYKKLKQSEATSLDQPQVERRDNFSRLVVNLNRPYQWTNYIIEKSLNRSLWRDKGCMSKSIMQFRILMVMVCCINLECIWIFRVQRVKTIWNHQFLLYVPCKYRKSIRFRWRTDHFLRWVINLNRPFQWTNYIISNKPLSRFL